MRLRRHLLLAVAGLSGCYATHLSDQSEDGSTGTDGDAPADMGVRDATPDAPTDAGPFDGGDADMFCEDVGRHRPCSPLCERDCPEGDFCDVHGGICRTFSDPLPARQEPRCSFNNAGRGQRSAEYCTDGLFCALKLGFDPDVAVERAGRCVDEVYCARAEELGTHRRCIYSDFTPWVNGPPEFECPASPSSLVSFCGRGCGDFRCPLIMELRPQDEMACVGMNEDRSFGLCTVGWRACPVPPEPDAGTLRLQEMSLGEPLACAVFREQAPSTNGPYGWVTSREVCREYKRRFPEALDCYDSDQNPVLP